MVGVDFQKNFEIFLDSVTTNLKENLSKLEKDYNRTVRRLEKVLKQSDNQQRQLISLNKELKDAYRELDDYRERLEEKVEKKVKELLEAKHDTLTKLPNRGMFQELLFNAIKDADEKNSEIALMFIDLDKFKQINDTLGHDAGDEILIQTVERVKPLLRDSDKFARLGGDEFTIIFDSISKKELAEISSNIIETVSADFHLKAGIGNIGESIGISIYPTESESKDSLIKNSDKAMYMAKESGRNCYKFYGELNQ